MSDIQQLQQDCADAVATLTAELARVTAERDAALRWQELAFQAHPNIDLDIEAIAAREG